MDKSKVLLFRFLRGFVAGFVASALTIIAPNVSTITELKEWVFALTLAGVVGGITGGLLALDKAIRWNPEQ